MNTKQTWGIIGATLLVVVLVVGFTIYTKETPTSEKNIGEEVQNLGTISLTIEGVYENKSVTFLEGETILQMLQTLNAENPVLKLSTKEYAGLGVLVDGMGEMKNGTDNKYWQYKVNGVMPQIGADKYTLTGDEQVEWYFAASEF